MFISKIDDLSHKKQKDCFMNLKKKLLTLCLLGVVASPSIYAKSAADASIKFSGRSGLPSANLSAGYSFGLWGKVPEPGAKDKDPMYGYVRAGIDYTWAFNTRYKLRLDIHPISIAKISVGTDENEPSDICALGFLVLVHATKRGLLISLSRKSGKCVSRIVETG